MDHLNRATHDGYHHSHVHKCQQALNLERAKKKKINILKLSKEMRLSMNLAKMAPVDFLEFCGD